MKFFAQLRSVLAVLAALSVTLFLTGCLQVEQVIKLKADGSGTFTVTTVMTKDAQAMLQGDAKKEVENLASEEKAKDQAGKLGEGVQLVSVEKIKNEVGDGAKVVFSFSDITKLKPRMEMPKLDDGSAEEGEPSMKFEFTPGSPAKLVVKTPHPDKPAKAEPDTDEAQLAQMQKMMKGMKVTMVIEADHEITSTDATYHTGPRVVFAEVPFDELFKDQAKFKTLNKSGKWEDEVKLLQQVPGMKIEPKETVTIQFK